MCHYIALHKASYQKDQSLLYLQTLYLQLSSLSSTVREIMLENPAAGGNVSSKMKKIGVNAYALRQLNALADKDGLALLLSSLSS